jgi:exodeoxyribonuclease VII large subunit
MTEVLLPPPLCEKPYSISQINAGIAARLEAGNTLVWAEAEISNCKQAGSGHLYLTLKDSGSQISAVMWRSNLTRLNFTPDNGMAVVLIATLKVYQKGGYYQLDIHRMQPAGQGALHIAFERLKQKLEKEGLFDPARKKPLPPVVRRLGVVTARTGAAIHDILRVVARRAPSTDVTLCDVPVQGPTAPKEIVKALRMLNEQAAVDCIIVGRGGGSMEDLWAFNDEGVCRAIFESAIPIISAVGHEIDFTMADFVADLRAPTPSAAAEIAIADQAELKRHLISIVQRFATRVRYYFMGSRERYHRLMTAPALRTPFRRISEDRQRNDELRERTVRSVANLLRQLKQRQIHAAGRLHSLSPLAVLSRGYSVVLDVRNAAVRSADSLAIGESVHIRFHQGQASAKISGIENPEAAEVHDTPSV